MQISGLDMRRRYALKVPTKILLTASPVRTLMTTAVVLSGSCLECITNAAQTKVVRSTINKSQAGERALTAGTRILKRQRLVPSHRPS
jgi:hypothetical protein